MQAQKGRLSDWQVVGPPWMLMNEWEYPWVDLPFLLPNLKFFCVFLCLPTPHCVSWPRVSRGLLASCRTFLPPCSISCVFGAFLSTAPSSFPACPSPPFKVTSWSFFLHVSCQLLLLFTWIHGISTSHFLPPSLSLTSASSLWLSPLSFTSDLCLRAIFIFPSSHDCLCQTFICSSWVHWNSFYSNVCPPNYAGHLAQLFILSLSSFPTITLFEMFFWLHTVSRMRSAIFSLHKLTPTYFSRFTFTLLSFQRSQNSRSLCSWSWTLGAFSCFLILIFALISTLLLPLKLSSTFNYNDTCSRKPSIIPRLKGTLGISMAHLWSLLCFALWLSICMS